MEKQTKNVITREFIENELRFYNKADIRSVLLCGSAFALFFIPITVLIVNGIYSEIDNAVLRNVLGIGLGVIFSSPVWGALLAARHSLSERKKLNGGEVEITLRTLQYKGEKLVQRHIEEYFSFGGFDDISVSPTAYSLATPGDEYYIVHYKGSRRIKQLYSAKTHEYKDQ